MTHQAYRDCCLNNELDAVEGGGGGGGGEASSNSGERRLLLHLLCYFLQLRSAALGSERVFLNNELTYTLIISSLFYNLLFYNS
jgi:hypothetical protein